MCFVFRYVVQFNTIAVVHCADESARDIISIIIIIIIIISISISSSSNSGSSDGRPKYRNRVVGVGTHYGKDDLSSETRWGVAKLADSWMWRYVIWHKFASFYLHDRRVTLFLLVFFHTMKTEAVQ